MRRRKKQSYHEEVAFGCELHSNVHPLRVLEVGYTGNCSDSTFSNVLTIKFIRNNFQCLAFVQITTLICSIHQACFNISSGDLGRTEWPVSDQILNQCIRLPRRVDTERLWKCAHFKLNVKLNKSR